MSYGEDLCRQMFELTIGRPCERNVRPVWLHGLELDCWFPDLRIGIEFQGDQHYIATFGHNEMLRQRERDRFKVKIMAELGHHLIRIDASRLQYTWIRMRLKQIFRREYRKKIPLLTRGLRLKLRELNAAAVRYRATLRTNFDSPSACLKGKGPRRAALVRFHAARQAARVDAAAELGRTPA